MDKLKKNRFWILLPLVVVLWIVSFLFIGGLSATTKSNWEKASAADKKLKGVTGEIRNDKWVNAAKKVALASNTLKKKYWLEAYDAQNGIIREKPKVEKEAPPPGGAADQTATESEPPLYGKIISKPDPIITFPEHHMAEGGELKNWRIRLGNEDVPLLHDGILNPKIDFGEPLGLVPLEYQGSYYVKQWSDLPGIVNPVNEKTGQGAVRFGGGAGASGREGGGDDTLRSAFSVLHPRSLTPISPRITDVEVWLLQEEIGIIRELLKIIRDANDSVAVMQPEWREILVPKDNTKAEPKKDAAAGGAPAQIPPSPEAEPKADAKKEPPKPEPNELDRKRFLNTTWHVGLPKPKEPAIQEMHTDWRGAWMLDLTLVLQDKDSGGVLKAKSTNHTEMPIPPLMFDVIVSDGANQEQRVSFDASQEAGKKNAQNPNRTDPHTREFEIKGVPVGAKKIVRLQRKPAAPAHDHQRFVNPYWLVDVKLVPASGGGSALEGTVFNLSGRRRRPGTFQVATADPEGQRFGIDFKAASTEPLNSGLSRDVNEISRGFRQAMQQGRPRQIIALRQVLDWQNAPIKRIDRIEMGQPAHYASDRTKIKALVEYEGFKTKNPNPAAATSTTAPPPDTGKGSPSGFGAQPPPGFQMPGAGGRVGGSGGDEGPRTPGQQVPTHRYVESSPELRRIPVALVLIVDQAHINDVTTAMGNSRLRIQVTMAPWVRVPNLAPPAINVGGAGPSGQPMPPVVRPGPMDRTGRMPQMAAAGGTEDSSLVELQIYGQAVIYENPEAEDIRKNRPKDAGTATAPGARK